LFVETQKERIPWREEFDKDEFLRSDDRVEIGRGQVDDIGSRICKGKSGKGKRC